MAIDTASPRSRRALLAAALGAGAATVASAIGRPLPARAVEGEPVVVGGDYTASSTTSFDAGDSGRVALFGRSERNYAIVGASTSGFGVQGYSRSSAGVHGSSHDAPGVFGQSQNLYGVKGSGFGTKAGVFGFSYTHAGVHGLSGDTRTATPGPANTGVYGYAAQDDSARGVYGQSPVGTGVRGYSTSGTGGSFEVQAATGHALATSGRIAFGKVSSIASIAVGKTSVTIKPGVDITASSFVLLTPRSDLGSRRWWVTTNAVADTFTIHVSATASTVLRISWLLVG